MDQGLLAQGEMSIQSLLALEYAVGKVGMDDEAFGEIQGQVRYHVYEWYLDRTLTGERAKQFFAVANLVDWLRWRRWTRSEAMVGVLVALEILWHRARLYSSPHVASTREWSLETRDRRVAEVAEQWRVDKSEAQRSGEQVLEVLSGWLSTH